MFKDKMYIVYFIFYMYFITYSVRNAEALKLSNKLKIQTSHFNICQYTGF